MKASLELYKYELIIKFIKMEARSPVINEDTVMLYYSI